MSDEQPKGMYPESVERGGCLGWLLRKLLPIFGGKV